MPARDPEYYREDGDLVVLVEDTLFRVRTELPSMLLKLRIH